MLTTPNPYKVIAVHRVENTIQVRNMHQQGELKRTGYDPLFPINHTLAMMRDNIKRFARRTWCTTKKVSALEDVIAIYMHYHNTTLIPAIALNLKEKPA